jgi:hypothetical protein
MRLAAARPSLSHNHPQMPAMTQFIRVFRGGPVFLPDDPLTANLGALCAKQAYIGVHTSLFDE